MSSFTARKSFSSFTTRSLHEKLQANYSLDLGVRFDVIPNHVEGKPSGHYWLRYYLIQILTKCQPLPPTGIALLFIRHLGLELFLQLQQFLAPLDIDLCLPETDVLPQCKYPVDEESAKKWEVEKIVLQYWLNKVALGTLDLQPERGIASYKSWICDSERIAFMYYKFWVEPRAQLHRK